MFKINERNLIGIVFTGFIAIFIISLVLTNCSNEIESNSLSPQLLKKMAIEKWNGVLPKVQSSNNSNLISID